jgi:hypothetical protein
MSAALEEAMNRANLPLLLKLVVPLHDTAHAFQVFYFFYNEFFFHDELPQWQPFGTFGVQCHLLLRDNLSPANYLVALAGWCLNAGDVLFLFNASLFLEQVVFLYGSYLLGRTAFRHRTTVFFGLNVDLCG